jgi:archaellum component FlaC
MEMDRTSRHILVKMDQIDGETTAAELRDSLGLEANQSIHYRMDNKLIPADLVEEGDRREQPGSRKPARIYELTDSGREWVAEHGHRVTLTDLDDAEDEIQRLSSQLQSLQADVQNLKSWRQEQSGQTGGMSTRLNDIGDRLHDLEGQMVKHNRRDYSGIWDQIHELDNRTENLSTPIPENPATEPEIKSIEDDVRDLDADVGSIESELTGIEATQSEWAEWGHQMEDRVRDLEQRTLLDYLLPWR